MDPVDVVALELQRVILDFNRLLAEHAALGERVAALEQIVVRRKSAPPMPAVAVVAAVAERLPEPIRLRPVAVPDAPSPRTLWAGRLPADPALAARWNRRRAG